MIHQDTSFLIRALVRQSVEQARLNSWLRLGLTEPIGISAIAWAEFLCGPVSPVIVDEIGTAIGEPIVFDGAAAMIAAHLFTASGRRRGSFQDCMIASAAMNADAALATSNVKDFERFVSLGLVLETP